jgi:hypothetical protein
MSFAVTINAFLANAQQIINQKERNSIARRALMSIEN